MPYLLTVLNVPLPIYFMGISFFVSVVIYFSRKAPFFLKIFPPFLFITLLVELFGFYLSSKGSDTRELYNFFTVFEFCFYLYVLSCIVVRERAKKIIRLVLIIYLFITLANILFFQRNTFHSITYSLGCLLIVASAIYYFLELFQTAKFIRLVNQPSFWICSGLLFYYCCSFPLFGITGFLSTIPKFLLNNIRTILAVINILLYSLFAIAFLCQFKIAKHDVSSQ